MIKLTKKDWEEVLQQNNQIAKNYKVSLMIVEKAIEMIEQEINKFPPENKKPNEEIKEEKKNLPSGVG